MARPATGIVKEKLNITLSRQTKENITNIAKYESKSISALVEQWTNDKIQENLRGADNRQELRKAKDAKGVVFSILVGISDKDQLEKLQAIAEEKNTSIENVVQQAFRSREKEFIESCIADVLKQEP